MKKSVLTLAALFVLSSNAFAAEETTGTAAGSTGVAGTAAVGTTTLVAVGVGAAALAAVVISEANDNSTSTSTTTSTKK
ncbi:hypothetical protein H9X88_00265 [Aeromonas hydrophila]|uniref:hypothetical protein n=1 Tax=Aeromonas hydrophila TaxID=644 RepID=UPI001B3A5F1D|nr:hypothetical protein [Aeromonas hydrophila]MBQ4677636.1 hypothetical protein [Aeromonas hydrophila]MBW3816240.1 hypothetical protein [Aeromonas hydrophila]MCF7676601.1 hypothetical protein [Aeromonas hydrophila]MCF7773319.1 hypothetical protein [Aeromonas hydrophila]